MRAWHVALALCITGVSISEAAASDSPPVWDAGAAWSPTAPQTQPPASTPLWGGTLPTPPRSPDTGGAPATNGQQVLNGEVQLGLPLGLRLQGNVYNQERCSFLLEGFAGLYVIIPMLGAGGRVSFTAYSDGTNALLIEPGLDAYFGLNPLAAFGGRAGLFALGADVEFAWYHDCGGHGWEVGLDLGALVLGHDSHAWGALPIVGVFAGFRF